MIAASRKQAPDENGGGIKGSTLFLKKIVLLFFYTKTPLYNLIAISCVKII